MSGERESIYLGVDCGATTSKVGAVDGAGSILSREVRQSRTLSSEGPSAMIASWMEALNGLLADLETSWDAVGGVGVAMPGPYEGYGILGKMPNMPASLAGWPFLKDLGAALESTTLRNIPVSTANDGQLAGLAEAKEVQAGSPGSVLMLSPGSGLGCSFVDARGELLEGDHLAAAILCHMPAPYERLGLPAFTCGCGRDWGCFEAYTAISGLPQLLDIYLPKFPHHPLAADERSIREKVLSLRDLAQHEDELAMAIFTMQAKALGFAVATGCMAYDPTHVIIGGGLMDPSATKDWFRERYIASVREAAGTYFWGDIEAITFHQASLGDLSQAIGAALYARAG
jgi:glucokinase